MRFTRTPICPAGSRPPGVLLLLLAVVVAVSFAVGCSKGGSSGSNGSGDDDGTGNLDGTGGSGNGTHVPPAAPRFRDPWTRATIGDQAIYLTPSAPGDGERWELTDDGIRITRTDGVDAMGFPNESTEVIPVNRDATGQWWSLPRPTAEPSGTHTLDDGTVLPTVTVTDGERTWLVSPDAPFDGVVRETVAGQETAVRQLLSFTRSDSQPTDGSD